MKLIKVMVFTVLLFNGCAENRVYVKSNCPKLQTYDVNRTVVIDYEVR